MSVSPYQFEPIKKIEKEKSDDEWEDIEDDDSEEEISNELTDLDISKKSTRLTCDVNVWCKCSHCHVMTVSRECLCCTEIDEIKFQKLSKGMIFFNFIFSLEQKVNSYFSFVCE